MSSKVSQKEYLKKYLSGDKKKHKSKKKRRDGSRDSSRVKIIDDDVDVRRKDYDDDDDLLTGEDAPQIVGIIDERPAELKTYEDFKSSNKWKSLSSNSHTATESGRRDDQRKSHKQSRERSVEKYRKSTSTRSRRSMSKDLSPARKRRRTPDETPQRDQSPPRRQRRDSSDDRRHRKDNNVFSNVSKRDNKMSNPFRGDVVDYRKPWKDERVSRPDWKKDSPPRQQYQGRDRRNDAYSKFQPSNKWRGSSSDRRTGQSNFNPFRSTSSSKQNPYPERNRNEYSDYNSNNDNTKMGNPFRSKPMPSFVNRPASPVHKMQATVPKPARRIPEAHYSKGSSFGSNRFNPFRENQNKNLESGRPKQFFVERNEKMSRWEDNSRQKIPPREKPLVYRKNTSGDFYEKRKPMQYAEKAYGKYDQDNNRHSFKRNFHEQDKYQKGNNFRNGRGFQNDKSAQHSVKMPSQSYTYGKRSYEDAFESKNSNQRQKEEYVDRRRDGKKSRWNNDTGSAMYEEKSSANQNRSDDDLSPVRKKKSSDGNADKRNPQFQPTMIAGKESGSLKIAKKTLDGKTSGLQSAKMLRDEAELFRKKENEMFEKISSDMSGRGAEAIVRNKFGRLRNSEERKNEDEKKERENQRKRTYSRWGKGLKQIEELQTKVLDDMHEMSKPLARYSDDADLDSMLKSRERVGDPMLDYIRKKADKNKTDSVPSVPVYKGSYPENRFNIRPGYRWDGVDRSNGYEQKWFDVQSQKKALQEEAYKYSTEDM